MPYKTEKTKLEDPFLDRRVRLLPCQKEMVKYWYEQGTGIRALSRMFNVNKRAIQFLLFPERLKHSKELAKQRGKVKPEKDAWAATMKEHRAYKYNTLKDTV